MATRKHSSRMRTDSHSGHQGKGHGRDMGPERPGRNLGPEIPDSLEGIWDQEPGRNLGPKIPYLLEGTWDQGPGTRDTLPPPLRLFISITFYF